jgi:hypothetical protein
MIVPSPYHSAHLTTILHFKLAMPPKCPPTYVFAKKHDKGQGKGRGKGKTKRPRGPRPSEMQSACINKALRNVDLSGVAGVIAADQQLTEFRCRMKSMEGLTLGEMFSIHLPRIDTALHYRGLEKAVGAQLELANAAQTVLTALGMQSAVSLSSSGSVLAVEAVENIVQEVDENIVQELLKKLPPKELAMGKYKAETEVVYVFKHRQKPFLKVGKFVISESRPSVLQRLSDGRDLDRLAHPLELNGLMDQQHFELICAVPFMYSRAENLIHNSPATKRINSTEFHPYSQLPAILQKMVEVYERNLAAVKHNLALLDVGPPPAVPKAAAVRKRKPKPKREYKVDWGNSLTKKLRG